MSDCRNGGRDVYAPACPITIEFEGKEQPWTYQLALNGRKMRRITVGGVEYAPDDADEEWITEMVDGALKVVAIERGGTRFEPVGSRDGEMEDLLSAMYYTWKRLDLEGDWVMDGHNGWRGFIKRLVRLGILEGVEADVFN